jgi:RimJ/RimL family protein N-acetyltransferase
MKAPTQAAQPIIESVTANIADVRWPICTKRLLIRPAELSDLEATWRFRKIPAVSEWLSSATTEFDVYRAKFEDPARLSHTLVFELDGLVIGDLMLRVEDGWAQAEVADRAKAVQAELGWCIDPAYSGHGYASEAVSALIEVCFTTLGLRRITANCFADNTASWRLMERLGMRRELYTVRESLHRSGEWLDGMGYALLVDEWQSRASRG